MIPVFNQEDKRKAIVQCIGGAYINLVQNGSLSKLDYWKTWPAVEDVLANDHIRPIVEHTGWELKPGSVQHPQQYGRIDNESS